MMLYYLVNTLVAMAIALALSNLVEPGARRPSWSTRRIRRAASAEDA